ncbi:mediator of RNA polymerase II transcription subunit 31-like isoform X2 [Fagus crenata]
MAHPGNKEVVHRQQFYFWKNYKNNRLKHIVSKSQLQADAAATPASLPPPPIPPTTIAVTAPPGPPESSVAATSSGTATGTATVRDLRSRGADRKRKEIFFNKISTCQLVKG